VVGGKLLYIDRPAIVNHAGRRLTPVGAAFDEGFGCPDGPQFDTARLLAAPQGRRWSCDARRYSKSAVSTSATLLTSRTLTCVGGSGYGAGRCANSQHPVYCTPTEDRLVLDDFRHFV